MKNKLLFLIFLMFPTLMLADYTFIVENQAMVESYFNIFNAISALLSSEDYLDLLRLTFLLGGFFVFAASVLTAWEGSANAKILSPYGKYLITGVALLTLVFSYKEPMWVTTNNIPSFCATPLTGMGVPVPGGTMVGTAVNLPSVLGFVFSTTNKIGVGLTELAESAFSTPSSSGSASMTDSGGYLGALKQTIKIMSYNPSSVNLNESSVGTGIVDNSSDFLNLWGKFFNSCVFAVANNKGFEGEKKINELKSSKDIFKWVDNYMSPNSGKGIQYTGDSKFVGQYLIESNGVHYECSTFYEVLKDAKSKLESNFACHHPGMNAGVLELLTGSTTGNISTLNEIALQSGLINSLSQSGSINSIGINGAQQFTEGKSRSSGNQANISTAEYMGKMLPYIQMTMRAILYAFFPFVFVVMLLPGGIKVLAQYGQTILWVELWGPTAAVVNMFVNMQVKAEVASVYGNSGLTYMSSIDMLSDANTIAGVGAMLYLSIPALTWLILKGSGQMLGNLTSGVSSKFGLNLDSKVVAQDLAQVKASKQSGRSISDTINSLEQMEVANKYGQATGFENGGGMNTAMDSSRIKTQSDLIATQQKIEAAGGNINNVANALAGSDSFNFATTMKSMQNSGMIKQDGTVDMKKLDSYSGTDGAVKAMQTLANSEQFKQYNSLTGKGLSNFAQEYANQDGSLKTEKFNTEKTRLENHAESHRFNLNTTEGRAANAASIGTTEGNTKTKQQEENEQEVAKLSGMNAINYDKNGGKNSENSIKNQLNKSFGKDSVDSVKLNSDGSYSAFKNGKEILQGSNGQFARGNDGRIAMSKDGFNKFIKTARAGGSTNAVDYAGKTKKFDADGNGYISMSEFEEGVKEQETVERVNQQKNAGSAEGSLLAANDQNTTVKEMSEMSTHKKDNLETSIIKKEIDFYGGIKAATDETANTSFINNTTQNETIAKVLESYGNNSDKLIEDFSNSDQQEKLTKTKTNLENINKGLTPDRLAKFQSDQTEENLNNKETLYSRMTPAQAGVFGGINSLADLNATKETVSKLGVENYTNSVAYKKIQETAKTNKLEEKFSDATVPGAIAGMKEAGKVTEEQRQINETSKEAIKTISSKDNIQTLLNESVNNDIKNDKKLNRLEKKVNDRNYTQADKKNYAEIKEALKFNNALSLIQSIPMTEEAINTLKDNFKNSKYEKDFNNILKENQLEKGNFNNYTSEQFYQFSNYLNGGVSNLKNDLNGNNIKTLNTNVLNQVSNYSTSRTQGHSSTSISNAAGFYEKSNNSQVSNSGAYFLNLSGATIQNAFASGVLGFVVKGGKKTAQNNK
jgi:hypothetical protein